MLDATTATTTMQLLHMMDDWTLCLEKGGQIDAIYSDFEKAFDKVPHKRLISKLYSYMIDEGVIKWIVNFLKARKYRVGVNSSYSGWHVTSIESHKAAFLDQFCF